MLAVKLHKNPKPWLGKGSHLVPVTEWKAGVVQIRGWIRMLRSSGRGLRNNKINFITLVRIPEEFPVRFTMKYGRSDIIKAVYWSDDSDFQPLKRWPLGYKKALKEWWDAWQSPWNEPLSEPGGVLADEPQIILGRKLPREQVLWTKDIRLLYGRNSTQKG